MSGCGGVKYLSDSEMISISFTGSSAVFVDEAHLLSKEKTGIHSAALRKPPGHFSSDCEDMISPEEMDCGTAHALEQIPGIQSFRLTNRIRTNAELSSFIQNMIHLPERKAGRHFPHVTVLYANDDREEEYFLKMPSIGGMKCFRGKKGSAVLQIVLQWYWISGIFMISRDICVRKTGRCGDCSIS